MLFFKVEYVCNIHQRAEQGHFNLYYNSLLFPNTDVNWRSRSTINELESNFVL